MEQIESYERAERVETQKANELEELVGDASFALENIILLEAGIVRTYPAGQPPLQSLIDQCKTLKNYVRRSTRYFEKAQDERAETSTQGRLSLNELYRRRNNADQRIKEIEERQSGKIIPYSRLREKQEQRARMLKGVEGQEPKGAA